MLQILGLAAMLLAARPISQATTVELDIPYSTVTTDDKRKLDLYLPEKKPFSTIVFFYGGGWHAGTRKAVTIIAKHFQKLGYGCAIASYRLTPPDVFPAHIEDAAAAFAWVKKHIAEKGGDAAKVFLMGHSSGAHLALLLATNPRYLAAHKLTPADIRAVVGLSTPTDLEPRKSGDGFGDTLMGGKGADAFSRDAKVMKDASPVNHISKSLPPTLLVAGENDFPMLPADGKAFVVKAKAVGADATFYLAKGRDHMGVVRSLLEDKDPVVAQVLAFLEKHK